MDIEKIIYHTTRETSNIEDKLSIATIFLFCDKVDSKLFAELLYTDNHVKFIEELTDKYSHFDVDFTIRFDQKNVSNSFYKTLEKVIEKRDKDGYYKALFEGDEFAIVISEIVNYNFNDVEFKKLSNTISAIQLQLKLDF